MTIEPFKIAPIIENDYHGIYEFVRHELGKEPISEVYSTEYFNEVVPDESFVEITLARCFPNDIHIVDVEFSDNRKPIPRQDPTRKFRKYKGLHVFHEFLERLKGVAEDKGAERISLLVASPPLYKVFSRHGFSVSETRMAQSAYNGPGHGYAMVLPLR